MRFSVSISMEPSILRCKCFPRLLLISVLCIKENMFYYKRQVKLNAFSSLSLLPPGSCGMWCFPESCSEWSLHARSPKSPAFCTENSWKRLFLQTDYLYFSLQLKLKSSGFKNKRSVWRNQQMNEWWATCAKSETFAALSHPPTSVIRLHIWKARELLFEAVWRGLRVVDSGVEHLRVAGFVLLVVELQDPDGGNDTDEEQEDWRRKPARQPTERKISTLR